MKTDSRFAAPAADGASFEMIEHLGAGAFAQTVRARVLDEDLVDTYGREEVVLKIPLTRQKARVLKREMELNAALHLQLKDLHSPYITRYLGFDLFDGQIVMVMEYVPGNLRRKLGPLGRQKPLSVVEAAALAAGILRGVMVIHEHHIFHRDLKPENILLDGIQPKIADFGVSRLLSSNELASSSTGTINYMSPECLGHEGATFSSDIWSVGVTLYEMVTGKLPFGDVATPIRTMVELICESDPPAAHALAPGVPRGLSDIIARALQKRPDDRFASAADMLNAMESFRRQPDEQLTRELAVIRQAMNDVNFASEVERQLRDLSRTHPTSPAVYQCLGELYNRRERYAEAIAAFRQGLQYDATNAILHWDLALAYQRTGQRDAAIESLTTAMARGLDKSLSRYAETLLMSLRRGGG